MVPPSHFPLPCGGRDGVLLGAFSIWWVLENAGFFYGFSSRCPDLTQRGTRNGSPFTLPPPCGGEKLVRRWWRLFCCDNESLPWWEAFSIRGVLFAGDMRGSWCRGRARRAGRRRRPHAAARGRRPRSPPRQGRAALRTIGWGFCGGGEGGNTSAEAGM